MERILRLLFGIRRRTPPRTEPPVTEEQRKAARRAETEYANFLSYDGTEQAPIEL